MARIITCILVGLMIGAFVGLVIIELMAGCGQRYVNVYGQVHYFDCVVVRSKRTNG